MNKLLTIGLLATSILSFGQEIKREILDKELGTPKIIVLDENSKLTEDQAISFLNERLKSESNTDFNIEKRQDLGDGRLLLRLKETVDGIEVFNSYYNVHLENGFVKKYNGKFINNISVINPTITKENALNKALEHFNANEYYWENEFEESLIKKIKKDENATHYPNPKLSYYDFEGKMQLCYVMDVYASKPYKAEKIFVNATNGKVINTISLLHDVNKEAVGISKFSDTVNIMTFESSPGVYTLKDYTRGNGVETYNMNNSTDYSDATEFTHDDSIWDISNANDDEVAIDAHWGAGVTYDYFMEKHGRNSYDGNGSTLMSFVHFDVNWSNASWNGYNMRYGDGSAGGNPYLGLDIVGHEISHGVTGNSAGLIYQGESGALNESFSDIFGNAIEYYSDSNRAEWLVGEQCFNQLRDMSNPFDYGNPKNYQGTYWASTAANAPDNGGVHINSGVQNYWFYLLVEGGSGVNELGNSYNVEAMGWDVAAEIAYRNLNEYLGVYSDYIDARDYSYEVATDMFGECTPEVLNVIEAWYAVGVGYRLDAEVNPDFKLNYSYACNLPLNIQFINETKQDADFAWTFGDGSSTLTPNPIHSYDSEGEYIITLDATINNDCFTSNNSISKTLNLFELGKPIETECIPTFYQPSNTMGIQSVSINTLFNESGLEDNDYNDYTCKSNTVLNVDSTYHVIVKTNESTKENVRIWIDFNNNGKFASNELIFSSDAQYGLHEGQTNFPDLDSNVYKTPVRMRVMSDILFNNDISPCGELRFGEVEDYSVALVKGVGTLNNKENIKSNVLVYPNPTQNLVNISLSNGKINNVRIIDLLGKEVLTTNKSTIDISDISSGIYSILVETNEGLHQKRLIKN